jgi:S-layer homology domain
LTCKTPAVPPGTLLDVVVAKAGGKFGTLGKGWFADFSDVPQTYLYHGAIEKLVRAGVTTGCGAGRFCPDNPVTRDAMAKFLLVAAHGSTFDPPAATGAVFCDVTASTLLAKWIEEAKSEGIASGAETGPCGEPNYHPTDPVTRDAMAKFLELARYGASYSPPAAMGGIFCDVKWYTFLAKWMEQLEADDITSGCGPGPCGNPNYCPNSEVSRGEMAKFLSKSFHLPFYGP